MSDSPPPGPAGLPETIGRYRILERIGQGGMGSVYRAVTEGPEGFRREVALKVVLTGTDNDDLRLKMFHDEARIVARLTHPGIAQVYDFGVDAGRVFLVMELVPGESMHRLIRRLWKSKLRLPEAVAMAIGTQVASALSYAHTATDEAGAPMGLVHRDISPDNLLVTEQGWVKLLDFGIVKAAGKDVQTQLGQVKGKPAYMSPEQVQGKELDGRSDIFALGVVLWEALAGERLWRGDEMPAIVAQLVTEEVRHLADLQPDLHPGAIDAVMALLERDPARRPDAKAAQAMLSRTLSAIRSGSPQEIVAAWRRGDVAPAQATPLQPPTPSPAVATPSRPTAPTGPGPESAWAPVPQPGGAPAPAFDASSLPPLEEAFEGTAAPPPGLATALEGTAAPPPGLSTALEGTAALPPPQFEGLPGPSFGTASTLDPGSDPDEPALELAYEPVPAALPEDDAGGLLPPSGSAGDPLAPPDLSTGEREASGSGQRPPPASTRRRGPGTSPGAASSRRPPWLAIGLGAGALAIVGVLAFVFLGEEPQTREAAADGKVSLRIQSTPAGASLEVNGQAVSAKTPTTVETLALRQHEIVASLEGHVPTTVKISYTQVEKPVHIRLQKLVRVEVTTDPPGAQVTADGRIVIMETPGSFEQAPGTYRLLASLEGRAPAAIELELKREPHSWSPKLPRAAFLQVKTRPPGAALFLEGVPLGVESPTRIAVAPRKTLLLEAKLGSLSARKKVKGPAPGKRGKVSLRLVDPVVELEKKQNNLQDEVDRLDELIQSATERIETGILSEREVRQMAVSRDKLQARQDRLAEQVEKMEQRLTTLRVAAEEARRPRR